MPPSNDQKEEVKQATDIVRLISEQVALKPRGKEFIGLCPFHNDKNPSMNVSPAKQIFKCYACGTGGDVFSFTMEYHKMSFREALVYLAERANIKLEKFQGSSSQNDGGPTDRQRIADANAKAVGFFRALYASPVHGRLAREYVQKRKISDEMVEAFQLGYAPDKWDGLQQMIASKNWDLRAFEMAGLVSPRTNGPGHYDRLRHRLIFPIFDAIGRPIAFGGRKMRDEDEPKYLNSPETPLFNKSATLYGLHVAKKPIIDSKTAVIVEGYTDVIACHQVGVRNVVATLGTALTPQHITTLRHYCDKVVLVYDGDEAGQKASDRAVEVFLTGDMDVFIAILPDELDPAELFEEPDGVPRWELAIKQARDALDHQFRRVREQMGNADTVTGRQKIVEDYLGRLARAGLDQAGLIRKTMVIQRLADLLHMNDQTIRELLKRLAPPPSRGRDAGQGPQAAEPSGASGPPGSGSSGASPGSDFDGSQGSFEQLSSQPPGQAPQVLTESLSHDIASGLAVHKIRALRLAERYVIGGLLRAPELFHRTLADGRSLDEALTPAEFVTSEGRKLYQFIYTMLADGKPVSLGHVLTEMASEEAKDLARLATDADAQVESAMNGKTEGLEATCLVAAESLVVFHKDLEYRLTRQSQAGIGSDTPVSDDEKLRQAMAAVDYAKKNNPRRIARLGNG